MLVYDILDNLTTISEAITFKIFFNSKVGSQYWSEI